MDSFVLDPPPFLYKNGRARRPAEGSSELGKLSVSSWLLCYDLGVLIGKLNQGSVHWEQKGAIRLGTSHNPNVQQTGGCCTADMAFMAIVVAA